MVDPGTGLTLLGAGIGGKDLVVKLLGPTADYLGDGIAAWTEHRVENVQRVFERAQAKLPPGELDRPGVVPPRVLSQVLDGAQFAEDELIADYLGGVLASSRSEVGRDDRDVGMAALIGRLSTYAIRSHYIFYGAMQAAGVARGINLRTSRPPEVIIPRDQYLHSMDFSAAEMNDINELIGHVMVTLHDESLIGGGWTYGDRKYLASSRKDRQFPEQGAVVVTPTLAGIALSGIAQGLGPNAAVDAFSSPNSQVSVENAPEIPEGACLLTDLPAASPT